MTAPDSSERRHGERRQSERRDLDPAPIVQWSEKFSTSVRAIDNDHKALFEEVATLKKRFDNGAEQAAIAQAIKSLKIYCLEHFEREEKFLESAHYPSFDAHKAEHVKFRKLVKELARLNKKYPERLDGKKVVTFLSNWLTSHILRSDMEYVPYLKGEKTAESDQVTVSVPEMETITLEVPKHIAALIHQFRDILAEKGQVATALEEVVQQFSKKQKKALRKGAVRLFCRED